MGVLATAARTHRNDLYARLLDARSRTDQLFGIVREEGLYDRPIPERHRIIFYLGHVEAFDWNLLADRAFSLPSFLPTFDQLFAFGIDPVGGGLPTDVPSDWPKREEIARYNRRLRDELDGAIEEAMSKPLHQQGMLRDLLEVAVEHRLMHAETLAYLLHQLPAERKIPFFHGIASGTSPKKSRLVDIPAGRGTLGLAQLNGSEFGWDNEFDPHEVQVPEFAIDSLNVSNRDFLLFLQAGGYSEASLWTSDAWAWIQKEHVEHPKFWRREGNLWMFRSMFGDIRLPLDWPVYVSHSEASAYAKWLGRKLPSEEQFHRAAYGTPHYGEERSYPWGEEQPTEKHGNFDFLNWDPNPVGSFPRGASAFGVHDLLGNGWEWTRTVFAPFPGFASKPFYPGYSANFLMENITF